MLMTQDSSVSRIDPVFYANEVFPELEPLFQFKVRPLADIKNDCVVVLDTNTLLVPYTVGKASLTVIWKTYRNLIAGGRLVVPGQVVREYARNRATKLAELHGEIARKRAAVQNIEADVYPLLQSMPKYVDLLGFREKINRQINDYRQRVDSILEEIRGWPNDSVREMYAELFKGEVLRDLKVEDANVAASLLNDWKRRTQKKIPPGYEDKGRVGDLLIWHVIRDVGSERKKSVLFVSQEFSKGDWRHFTEAGKGNNVPFHIRFELVDEFRRVSGGQSFHMIQLHELLALFGASADVVESVRVDWQRASPAWRSDEGQPWTWQRVGDEAASLIPLLETKVEEVVKLVTKEGPSNMKFLMGSAYRGKLECARKLVELARSHEGASEFVEMLPPWDPPLERRRPEEYLEVLRAPYQPW
jgi:hypothetical protein